MSLASMVDTHLANQQGKDGSKVSPDKPVGVSTNLVNQITRWIPTETITVYVALLALVAPISAHSHSHSSSYASRWVLFAIVAAANPIVVYLIYTGKKRSNSDLKKLPSPVFAMVIAPFAFAAWAFSLPDTPLSSISGYSVRWNSAILVVTTAVVSVAAYAMRESPNYEQVQTTEQGAVNNPAGGAA